MKWIVSVHEAKDGHLEEFRVLGWSLDRPDIEFQWSKQVIVKAILEGREYRTAIKNEDGEFVEGSDVIVVEHEDGDYDLRTKANDVIEDNLGELPRF